MMTKCRVWPREGVAEDRERRSFGDDLVLEWEETEATEDLGTCLRSHSEEVALRVWLAVLWVPDFRGWFLSSVFHGETAAVYSLRWVSGGLGGWVVARQGEGVPGDSARGSG